MNEKQCWSTASGRESMLAVITINGGATASEMLGAPSKRRRFLAGSSLIFHFLLFDDTAFSIDNGPVLAVCVSRVETMRIHDVRVFCSLLCSSAKGVLPARKTRRTLFFAHARKPSVNLCVWPYCMAGFTMTDFLVSCVQDFVRPVTETDSENFYTAGS
jgi:hypothetical protein